ncbi:YdcF family protein [uncultured Rhodoblastus sp.]|uniref:YdcF family protein n=1 Tax=uncultured Rhodoblastus sp. TaxID=543037 RepID=UPI0025EC7BCF|nr:YdcF family protein [uncultured Rhodoblastus sp.]
MFFIVSKLFWFIASPLHFLLIALGVGLFFAPRRAFGLKLAAAAATGLALIAFSPLDALLLRPLEDRFPTQSPVMAPPKGIIVLGGALSERISKARGQIAVNEAAERLTAAAALARLYPDALLVFSGGSGSLIDDRDREAAAAHRFWSELGVPENRMMFEDASRNTYENAVFTQNLVHPRRDEKWLLVTSAFHMPRSIGIFRALGMNPLAFPVDYRTEGAKGDFLPPADGAQAIQNVETALREWVGLVAYRLTGKTDALFPAP